MLKAADVSRKAIRSYLAFPYGVLTIASYLKRFAANLEAVEILDLNYNPRVLLSADAARTNSFEPARRKAYTVLKKGMSSGAFAKSIGSPPVTKVIEGDASLRASAGGLPILKAGAIIGALAVSSPTGQDTDEACAQAGIAKFRL